MAEQKANKVQISDEDLEKIRIAVEQSRPKGFMESINQNSPLAQQNQISPKEAMSFVKENPEVLKLLLLKKGGSIYDNGGGINARTIKVNLTPDMFDEKSTWGIYKIANDGIGVSNWRWNSNLLADINPEGDRGDETNVVFIDCVIDNRDGECYAKVGQTNFLKRSPSSAVGSFFNFTLEEAENNLTKVAREASEFLMDKEHFKWLSKNMTSNKKPLNIKAVGDFSPKFQKLIETAIKDSIDRGEGENSASVFRPKFSGGGGVPKYKVAGREVTIDKKGTNDQTKWTVTFIDNGKTSDYVDVVALITPRPKLFSGGGGVESTSHIQGEIDDIRNWDNDEIANYIGVPISYVARDRNRYIREAKNYMMLNTFETGGNIGFKELSSRVAKSYQGKAVAPKYQSQYGKKYSKSEAREVGDKVAGKVYWQQQSRKFGNGGVVEKQTTGNKILDKLAKLLKQPKATIEITSNQVRSVNGKFPFSEPTTFFVKKSPSNDYYYLMTNKGTYRVEEKDVSKAEDLYDELESIIQAGKTKIAIECDLFGNPIMAKGGGVDDELPYPYQMQWEKLINDFGKDKVMQMFTSGANGYYTSITKGNYSDDAIRQSLKSMFNQGGNVNGLSDLMYG